MDDEVLNPLFPQMPPCIEGRAQERSRGPDDLAIHWSYHAQNPFRQNIWRGTC